jgi:hypothetical protein
LSSTGVTLQERWLGKYPPIWLKYRWEKAWNETNKQTNKHTLSMNRLNQIESTFSFFYTYFRDSISLYIHHRFLCRVEAVKCRPVHTILDAIFPILDDLWTLYYICRFGTLFLSCFLVFRRSVMCRLHNILFHLILFRPLLSRLWYTHYFTWWPYAFHVMAPMCRSESSIIAAVWTHLQMFPNSNLKCSVLLKLVQGGRTVPCI